MPELRDIPELDNSSKRKATAADDDDEPLFVSSSDEDFFQTQRERPPKRRKRRPERTAGVRAETEPEDDDAQDDKKKLALSTSYDGFSIYGRILCLVVKRKGKKAQPSYAPVGGSQMMEQWVSTQAAQEAGLNDDDDG